MDTAQTELARQYEAEMETVFDRRQTYGDWLAEAVRRPPEEIALGLRVLDDRPYLILHRAPQAAVKRALQAEAFRLLVALLWLLGLADEYSPTLVVR